jgi:hypothetical protein
MQKHIIFVGGCAIFVKKKQPDNRLGFFVYRAGKDICPYGLKRPFRGNAKINNTFFQEKC